MISDYTKKDLRELYRSLETVEGAPWIFQKIQRGLVLNISGRKGLKPTVIPYENFIEKFSKFRKDWKILQNFWLIVRNPPRTPRKLILRKSI